MKKIKVDSDKCTACLTCEVACSLHNLREVNPKKSMIRVRIEGDQYIPVIAGPSAVAESNSKHAIVGEAGECNLCFACVKWCASGALTIDTEGKDEIEG